MQINKLTIKDLKLILADSWQLFKQSYKSIVWFDFLFITGVAVLGVFLAIFSTIAIKLAGSGPISWLLVIIFALLVIPGGMILAIKAIAARIDYLNKSVNNDLDEEYSMWQVVFSKNINLTKLGGYMLLFFINLQIVAYLINLLIEAKDFGGVVYYIGIGITTQLIFIAVYLIQINQLAAYDALVKAWSIFKTNWKIFVGIQVLGSIFTMLIILTGTVIYVVLKLSFGLVLLSGLVMVIAWFLFFSPFLAAFNYFFLIRATQTSDLL